MSDEHLTIEQMLRALSFCGTVRLTDQELTVMVRGLAFRVALYEGSYYQPLREFIWKNAIILANDVIRTLRNHHCAVSGSEEMAQDDDMDEATELQLFDEHCEWLAKIWFDRVVFEAGESPGGRSVVVFRLGTECKFSHMAPESTHTLYEVANNAVGKLVEPLVLRLLSHITAFVAASRGETA